MVNDENDIVNDKNDVEKTDNRILSLITNNKEVTIKELAVLAGKSTRTVARAIKKLKDFCICSF